MNKIFIIFIFVICILIFSFFYRIKGYFRIYNIEYFDYANKIKADTIPTIDLSRIIDKNYNKKYIRMCDKNNNRSKVRKIYQQNFCDFNSDGCKSDSLTGEIRIKLLKSGEKIVNAHYFKYNPTVETQVSHPLIISLASGYRWDKLKIFVTSLRNSGYDGSLFLFVDVNYNNSNLSYYFDKYNVTPILVDDIWPFYSSANEKYPIDKSILDVCMIPKRDYSRYKWVIYRVSLLHCFLKQYKHLFSHILYMDCRDITFQLNPFEWNIEPFLYFVEETDADYCIGVDPFDGSWVKPYKHSNHVYNCRILNSGSILGTSELFYRFIKRISEFITSEFVLTAEQGTLNYMFYTQNLTDIPILMNRNGFGFALTLAVDLLYRPDNSFFPHTDMYIYNKDGTKPCFIHQYDRKYDKYKDWEKHMSKEKK